MSKQQEVEDTKQDTKMEYPACKEMQPSTKYVDGTAECLIVCHHFGIDTRGKGNATKYQCGVCKDCWC